jgi:integrase
MADPLPRKRVRRGARALRLAMLAAMTPPRAIAKVHSITWSARARSEFGISTPKDFAAFRLMLRSNLVIPTINTCAGSVAEIRALRPLQREQQASPFVFTSERGAPFSTAGWAKMVERLGVAAGLGFKAHPHMLRHACGYALANKGKDTRTLQAYLGHRNIAHTVRYAELAPGRFKGLWDD